MYFNTGMALLGMLVFFLFSSTTCSDDEGPKQLPEEEDCGPKVTGAKTLGIAQINPADYYSYTEEGYAYYSFSNPSLEHVCALKHIKGKFYYFAVPEHADEIEVSAEVVYGILFTYPIGAYSWKGESFGESVLVETEYDFGIKHVYGEDPGWFMPIMTISILDQGSVEANHELFRNAILEVGLRWEYYAWKAQ